MIISKTPLRISLGGGGTDLPNYYRQNGHGFLIAAAINKYVYVAVHRNFEMEIFLKYSEIERAKSLDEIQHPLLRECLRKAGCDNQVEISSMADIPAGTGLGSSGAFAVGTLNALYMHTHRNIDPLQLAAQACHIEMDILKEPVGKQDQYIAATGGIKAFTFRDDESVLTEELNLDYANRVALEENLVLFYTGVRRSASEVLSAEQAHARERKTELRNNLSDTRDIGYHTRETLLGGRLKEFGALLTDQWKLKYQRQPTAEHDMINEWIENGIKAGALGGKLVGAGGGGFLLFYAPDKTQLRLEMAKVGLVEVPFDFDYEGTSIVVTK